MSLPPGTRLGPYELVAPIGAGGMGEVYRAHDRKLDRDVAVKVLPEAVAKDPDALARFEREARAVAALSHPNILAIFDFGKEGDVSFAVMELLEGESLFTRLEKGPLAPRRAADLAIQAAHGLAAAHEKGVVHRDLKPDNLWITKDERLKILDFGLAKRVQTLRPTSDTALPTEEKSPGHDTGQGIVLGTLGYMSPEQVRGELVDGRTDIFSFGVVLFEVLTGRRAFARRTPADTMAAILKEDPPEIEETGRTIPPALRRIVDRCLEKSASRRFQSAQDLAFALENALGASSSPGSIAAADRGPRSRRRRALAATAAVLLLGIGLAAGWALAPGRTEPPRFRKLTSLDRLSHRARFTRDGPSVVYMSETTKGESGIFLLDLGSPVPRTILEKGTRVGRSPRRRFGSGLFSKARSRSGILSMGAKSRLSEGAWA